MRLIDANKLPWVDKVILLNKVDGDIHIDIAKEHTSYVNNETPTVDAIPISIIKEELDYARKMYDNSTELTEPYWRGNVSALEVLIVRWEKENDRD